MNKSLVGFYAPVEWKVNGITFGANLLAWTGYAFVTGGSIVFKPEEKQIFQFSTTFA